jgi:hypothetical protein
MEESSPPCFSPLRREYQDGIQGVRILREVRQQRKAEKTVRAWCKLDPERREEEGKA